jgi:hypothetical protein
MKYFVFYPIYPNELLISQVGQLVIKSSRNETLVLSIWIRILVPNSPSTTAWDHTSNPSSKSAMCPNGILAVGCIPIGSVVILVMGHY